MSNDTDLASVELDMLRHALRCVGDDVAGKVDSIFGTPMSTSNRQQKRSDGPEKRNIFLTRAYLKSAIYEPTFCDTCEKIETAIKNDPPNLVNAYQFISVLVHQWTTDSLSIG